MFILLIQIIGAVLTAFIAVIILKKDWRTKNEAIKKEALLVTNIIIAITVVSVLNLAISFIESQVVISQLERDKQELKIVNANQSLELSENAVKQSKLISYYQKESMRQIKLATNNIQHLINGSNSAPLFRFTLAANKTFEGMIVNKDDKPVYNLSVKVTNYDNLFKCKSTRKLMADKNCFVSNTIFSPAILTIDGKSRYYLKLPKFNNKASWGRFLIVITFNKKTYYEEAIFTNSKNHGFLQALRVVEYSHNGLTKKTTIKNKEYNLKKINWDKAFPLRLDI